MATTRRRAVGDDVAVVACAERVHDGVHPTSSSARSPTRNMLRFEVTRAGGGPWRNSWGQTTPIAA
ncbi:MAG TPA: hypothetical protein VJM49_15970 [Acidimicrobiales bacterium]|nr:hypothetical protein [Acidimicrobiales bacterium]